MKTSFNRKQLATWDEARECARLLSAGPITVGDGVRPQVNQPGTSEPDMAKSGIYRPAWLEGPSAFPEPQDVDEKTGKEYWFLHLRFFNGAEGMNVGLILDQFRKYPNSPAYVLKRLQDEANMLAEA